MPKPEPNVFTSPKFAQKRLLEIAKLAGWEPTCAPIQPDDYIEDRIKDWLQMKEILRGLRRIMT